MQVRVLLSLFFDSKVKVDQNIIAELSTEGQNYKPSTSFMSCPAAFASYRAD
jgi:hypothetical protein